MRSWLAPVLLVALATVLAELLWPLLGPPDAVIAYLVAVIGAAWLGRRAALVAALGSVFAYNFFFVEPYHTLRVADLRSVLTFAGLLGVGILVGTLTDRIRAREAEVREASVRARTEEIRAALLSSVSHDLRTPLATIIGSATALRDAGDRMAPEDRDALLDAIRDEAARMERLVADLLDTTRITTGQLAVKREWVPVDELVGSALRRVDAARVRVALAPDLPLVPVDPVLVVQALVNLLSNASRHAPDSEVEVRAERDAIGVRFVVADHGPGLPAERARLFEPFVRGARGGTGLGLAICRGVAAAHGGSIDALDTPGGGASFVLRLPIVGVAPVAAEAAP